MEAGTFPQPGDAIAVVQTRLADDPVQAEGVIASSSMAGLAVQFPAALNWEKDTEVLLVIGAGAQRQVVPARLVATRDRVSAFRMLGEWRRVNLRAARRYKTDLRADVRPTAGGSRQQGTIVDISLGGMAIEVPRDPGCTEVDVSVQAGGFAASLRCEVVEARDGATWTLLRLRFHDLSAIQAVFVRNLVESLEAQARSRAS